MRRLAIRRETLRRLTALELERAVGGVIHTAYGEHGCRFTDLSCGQFCTQGQGCGGSDTCTTGYD